MLMSLWNVPLVLIAFYCSGISAGLALLPESSLAPQTRLCPLSHAVLFGSSEKQVPQRDEVGEIY